PEKSGQIVAGWLIVHTEDKEPVSYDLFFGDNFFGTEAEGYKVDIPIEGDKYVSRSHANIRISKDFLHRFHYELLDDGSRRPQGPSLNGTYVNGNQDRLPQDARVFLQDGDTIQVGETKLVFKSTMEAHSVEEAATSVLNTDYTATVILSK
ncbi:MAG: FHA domain-containing protein, partial [Phaeodactylibacter sp.]|nr:FHA domain-containing protein [Phaeodactylibacter sp.]